MLQQAYAIEIGAIEAYEGHWRSLPTPQERGEIQAIQLEEMEHREAVSTMLTELGAKPNLFYNKILWLIGRTISIGCKVMGYRMAMWGAGIMEKFGTLCYKTIAKEAKKQGLMAMASDLESMQAAEDRHEKFFKSKLY